MSRAGSRSHSTRGRSPRRAALPRGAHAVQTPPANPCAFQLQEFASHSSVLTELLPIPAPRAQSKQAQQAQANAVQIEAQVNANIEELNAQIKAGNC